jgi:flagellar biosynthesis protein FliR
MIVEGLVYSYFAAIARCAGCLMLLPGFSSSRVPMQIRLMFLLALAGVIVPFSNLPVAANQLKEPLQLVSLLAGETFIGAMLAASVRIFVLAVGFFATAASNAIGMSGQLGASIVDTDAEPPLATLLSMTILLILFALDFHHPVILALAASYDYLPLGGQIDPAASARQFVHMLADGFSTVFRLAGPFLAFALLSNFYIALVNKLAPNLQLYFMATPAVIIGGIFLAFAVLPVVHPMSIEAINQILRLP